MLEEARDPTSGQRTLRATLLHGAAGAGTVDAGGVATMLRQAEVSC